MDVAFEWYIAHTSHQLTPEAKRLEVAREAGPHVVYLRVDDHVHPTIADDKLCADKVGILQEPACNGFGGVAVLI